MARGCPECGRDFAPKSVQVKWCSKECGEEGRRRYAREKYRERAAADPVGTRAYANAVRARHLAKHPDQSVAKAWRAAHPTPRANANASIQKWRERNPDQNRAYKAAAQRRRRARIAKTSTGRIRLRDLERLLRAYRGTCAYCPTPLTADALHWDHIVPLARGGSDTIGNYAPSCPACNTSKGPLLLMEWRISRLSRVRAEAPSTPGAWACDGGASS